MTSFSEADLDLAIARYFGLSVGMDAGNNSITSFSEMKKLPRAAKEILDFFSIESLASKPTSAPRLPALPTSACVEPGSNPNQLT